MTGSLPNSRMHEYAGVDTHDVTVEPGHRIPPVLLYVVLELHAHLAIIINCSKTVINLTGREYEAIFLAMCDKHLEKFVLSHCTIIC